MQTCLDFRVRELTICFQSDTFLLVLASVKDFFFKPPSDKYRLPIRPGISSLAMNVDEPLDLVPDESGPSVPANGGGTSSTKASRFDPNFTDAVIAATGPKANARLAQVMPSLLRHLHDFARENEITVDEWTAAVEMVWWQSFKPGIEVSTN